MAATRGILALLHLARLPIALAVIWAITGLLSYEFVADHLVLDIIFVAVRVVLVGAAGYFASKGSFGLWGAAFAGASVFFADHVLVKGIAFLISNEVTAAGGVLVSFAMLVGIAMVIGALGGAIEKSHARKDSAAI